MNYDNDKILSYAVAAIRDEANGLLALADTLGSSFISAISIILQCRGRVIIAGMGKSGHIGRKIAATLASTGTPAFFVHPAEASHGDLGMIEQQDVVITLSKSGESPELGDIVSYCRRFRIPIIAVTAKATSSLGQAADCILLLPEIREACPLGLAPTTSTTMTLALGDALAIACLKARDFQTDQFSEFHPGGKLGQKLKRVRDVMHTGEQLPLIFTQASLADAVLEMTRGRFGCVGIRNEKGNLVGVFTDGDLRRHFSVANMNRSITELMNSSPQQISPDALIADVAHLFTQKRIPSVFACVDNQPVGIIHVHDLLQKGYL